MPTILANDLEHYWEEAGQGDPLVFIHGAFADADTWEHQFAHFSSSHRVIRYDLRGHGRTGASALERYTLMTFVDDLACLLEALDVHQPVLCGQSFGGSIAMAFASRHPGRLRALVLCGSMVAIDLTLLDKFLCRVLVPGWAMTALIRAMSVDQFVRFSLWLGRLTKGRDLLSRDETTRLYLEDRMRRMEKAETLKFWQALYGYHRQPLERITCPTLVLNGELEPRSMQAHRRDLLTSIPGSSAGCIPGAHHAANMDAPAAFNAALQAFLSRLD